MGADRSGAQTIEGPGKKELDVRQPAIHPKSALHIANCYDTLNHREPVSAKDGDVGCSGAAVGAVGQSCSSKGYSRLAREGEQSRCRHSKVGPSQAAVKNRLGHGLEGFVRARSTRQITVKFKNLPQDEALRRLLGKLNFRHDETNGVTRLSCPRPPPPPRPRSSRRSRKDYRIANEAPCQTKSAFDQYHRRTGQKARRKDRRPR